MNHITIFENGTVEINLQSKPARPERLEVGKDEYLVQFSSFANSISLTVVQNSYSPTSEYIYDEKGGQLLFNQIKKQILTKALERGK